MTIKFKILEMSEGAANLLAIAKSKAEAQISEFAGELGFHRAWPMGDFLVRMQANRYTNTEDWVVRLWLTGQGIGEYFYGSMVPVPCVCRTVYITADFVSVGLALEDQYSEPSSGGGNFFGTVKARVSGQIVATAAYSSINTGGIAGSAEIPVRQVRNAIQASAPGGTPKPSPYALYNADPTFFRVDPSDLNSAWILISYNEFWTQPFDGAINGAVAQRKIRVRLSDGVELASTASIINSSSVVINAPYTTVWSGDGFVELQNGSRLNFSVPDDVCRPASPDTPPVGYPPALHAGWAAARVVATERERARVKACSDAFIANLEAGAFDGLHPYIRVNRVYSTHTYMPTLMSVAVVDGSFGSGDDITFTKDVTLSYSYVDESGATQLVSQVINGTRRVVITRCADSTGTPNAAFYTTTTYSSWLPITASGSTGAVLDHTFVRDQNTGLAQVMNGVTVTGAANITVTTDAFGRPYVPPLPVSSDDRTYTYPQIYREYRARIERAYRETTGNTSWLDSAFMDDEIIDVVPLSVIHPTLGDLGVFAQQADRGAAGLTLRADWKFRFRYDYETGEFTFVRKQKYVDSLGTFTTLSLPYSASLNFVFETRARAWDDVMTTYKTQDEKLRPSSGALLTDNERIFQAIDQATFTTVL